MSKSLERDPSDGITESNVEDAAPESDIEETGRIDGLDKLNTLLSHLKVVLEIST